MDCLWMWAAGRSWLWWALLGQVAVVAGLVLMGIGWCGGRDRDGAYPPQAEKRRERARGYQPRGDGSLMIPPGDE